MSAPTSAARAPALSSTAASAAKSVSAPAAEATTQGVAAALGPGLREAAIATETTTVQEEDAAAQAPPSKPISPIAIVRVKVIELAHKPPAVPPELKQFLEQFNDPDQRLDTKVVLEYLFPDGPDIAIDAESMEKYIDDDGSFRVGDGEIVVPYLMRLWEAILTGRAAELSLKRFVPDSGITVKMRQSATFAFDD